MHPIPNIKSNDSRHLMTKEFNEWTLKWSPIESMNENGHKEAEKKKPYLKITQNNGFVNQLRQADEFHFYFFFVEHTGRGIVFKTVTQNDGRIAVQRSRANVKKG